MYRRSDLPVWLSSSLKTKIATKLEPAILVGLPVPDASKRASCPLEEGSPDSWTIAWDVWAVFARGPAGRLTGRHCAAKTRPRGTTTTHSTREDVATAIAQSFAKREHP